MSTECGTSSRIWISPKNSPGTRVREENFLFAEELRHAQLAFQHHIEEIRRIAFAKDYLPGLAKRTSVPVERARALGVVELREKRDVENCRERSVRNGGTS